MAAGVHIFDRTQDQPLPLRISVVKNYSSSKRRNQIYLISKLSFLYFEGRGLYMEAITINQETILSSKRGVITQWSRHDNVLLGFLFIWQTSLLISSGKTFSAKAKSVKKIFWPPRIDLFYQNSIVDVQFESRRGLFYDYRHYCRQIQIYCSHSQIFQRVDILQCRSSFSNCCIQSNWLFFLII